MQKEKIKKEKKNLKLYLILYIKINYKSITDLNVKWKTIKYLG